MRYFRTVTLFLCALSPCYSQSQCVLQAQSDKTICNQQADVRFQQCTEYAQQLHDGLVTQAYWEYQWCISYYGPDHWQCGAELDSKVRQWDSWLMNEYNRCAQQQLMDRAHCDDLYQEAIQQCGSSASRLIRPFAPLAQKTCTLAAHHRRNAGGATCVLELLFEHCQEIPAGDSSRDG